MKTIILTVFVGLTLPVFVDPTTDKSMPLFVILGLIAAGCVISIYNDWNNKK